MNVAIRGAALRTVLGSSPAEVAARLLRVEHGMSALPEGYACRLGAAVPGSPSRSRHDRFLQRMAAFALETGREAVARAGVRCAPERLGLYAGVGGLRAQWADLLPALRNQRDDGEGAWQRGLSRLHPFWMLQHLSNNAHSLLSIELDARGDGATFGGATAGAQALGAALRALRCGAVDAALVVAYDSLLEPELLVELAARGVTSMAGPFQHRPAYDPRACGALPGEAAAALVLERAERGALVWAGNACEGDGEPSSSTLARAAARLAVTAVVLDGPGRGWPALDASDRAALSALAGAGLPLSCTTASLGLLGAATAPVQAIVWAELLRLGRAPPIAGLSSPADGPLRPLVEVELLPAGAALCLSGGAPGLAAAVAVEVRA